MTCVYVARRRDEVAVSDEFTDARPVLFDPQEAREIGIAAQDLRDESLDVLALHERFNVSARAGVDDGADDHAYGLRVLTELLSRPHKDRERLDGDHENDRNPNGHHAAQSHASQCSRAKRGQKEFPISTQICHSALPQVADLSRCNTDDRVRMGAAWQHVGDDPLLATTAASNTTAVAGACVLPPNLS